MRNSFKHQLIFPSDFANVDHSSYLEFHYLKWTPNPPPVCSFSQLPSSCLGCCKEKGLFSGGLKVDSSLWNLWILSLTRIVLSLSSRFVTSLASDQPRSFFWTTLAISATRSDSAFSVGLYLWTWTTSSLSPSSLEMSE